MHGPVQVVLCALAEQPVGAQVVKQRSSQSLGAGWDNLERIGEQKLAVNTTVGHKPVGRMQQLAGGIEPGGTGPGIANT